MLPPNRKTKTLKDVATIGPKKSLVADVADNTEVSFVPMTDLSQEQKLFEVQETRLLGEVRKGYTYFADNDVLLAKVTPSFENGKCGIAKNLTNSIGFGSSEIIVFRPNPETLSEYLYYFLSRKDFREIGANNMSGAVGLQRIKKHWYSEVEIPLPPLSTQKAIVAQLDKTSAEITQAQDQLQAQIKKLDELWISTLNDTIKKDKYKKYELGKITSLVGGGTPKTKTKEYRDNGDVLWLTPTDLGEIAEIIYFSDTNKKITELGLEKSSAKLMPPGTVFFSSRASIGKIGISDKFVSTNQGFANFNCSDRINNIYLCYVLIVYLKEITSLSNSTTFKEVSKSALKKFKIPVPPLSKQKSIVAHLDQLSQEINSLKTHYTNQIKHYDELRSSILDQAFKGELVE